MKAVLTVIGKDKKGIIAKVSNLLAEKDANIMDISQTILSEYFTMIMVVDLSTINTSLKELNDSLIALGKETKVSIRMQHEDVFNSMHRI